jgi:hypothetical protein
VNIDYFLETFPCARLTWAETIMLAYVPCVTDNLKKFAKKLFKNTSPMK